MWRFVLNTLINRRIVFQSRESIYFPSILESEVGSHATDSKLSVEDKRMVGDLTCASSDGGGLNADRKQGFPNSHYDIEKGLERDEKQEEMRKDDDKRDDGKTRDGKTRDENHDDKTRDDNKLDDDKPDDGKTEDGYHDDKNNMKKEAAIDEFGGFCNDVIVKNAFVKFPHIRICSRLGQGAFSQVYLVTPENGVEKYAMKVQHVESRHDLLCIVREMMALKLVQSHPGWIRVETMKHFSHFEHFLFILECASCDLQQCLSKMRLAYSTIRSFSLQMLNAVHFLHTLKIVHCDLKPSNILISPAMCIKLSDLGLCRPIGQIDDYYLCTRWYRAPELLKCLYWNEKIDIWSVGCTIYEMIFGRVLFRGHNALDMLTLIYQFYKNDTVYKNTMCDCKHLSLIMRHCLEFNVERRYSAKVLMAILKNDAPTCLEIDTDLLSAFHKLTHENLRDHVHLCVEGPV